MPPLDKPPVPVAINEGESTNEQQEKIHAIFEKERLLRNQIVARYEKTLQQLILDHNQTLNDLMQDIDTLEASQKVTDTTEAIQERLAKFRVQADADKELSTIKEQLVASELRIGRLLKNNAYLQNELTREQAEKANSINEYEAKIKEQKVVEEKLIEKILTLAKMVPQGEGTQASNTPVTPLPEKPPLDITFHDENTILINPNTVTMRDGKRVDIELDANEQLDHELDFTLSQDTSSPPALDIDLTEHEPVPPSLKSKQSLLERVRKFFTKSPR